MVTSTSTAPRPSSSAVLYPGPRDPANGAALELLGRAAEQAYRLRQRRAPFQAVEAETADEAARCRAMVATNANSEAWVIGRPPAAARKALHRRREMTPEQRQRLLEQLACNREAMRQQREDENAW